MDQYRGFINFGDNLNLLPDMKSTICSLLVVLSAGLYAAQPIVVDLWPDGAPGDNGLTEYVTETGRISDVSRAELEVFLPDAADAAGQAVIVCPGGGYRHLAIDHEGRDVARWLSECGIAGVVLKYRMPAGDSSIPTRDVFRAIETVRDNAAAWNIDPGQVGVMGFSAGGHLASTAMTHYESPEQRPDSGILVYARVSLSDKYGLPAMRQVLCGTMEYTESVAAFSNVERVTPDTPPVLILFSNDDPTVDPRNGTAFYDAARINGVPAEIHIWPTGGHGWGWREEFEHGGEMRNVVVRWLSGLR